MPTCLRSEEEPVAIEVPWIAQVLAMVATAVLGIFGLFQTGRLRTSAVDAEAWLTLLRKDPGFLFSAPGNSTTPAQAAALIRYLKLVSGEHPMEDAAAYQRSVDPNDPMTDPAYLATFHEPVSNTAMARNDPAPGATITPDGAAHILDILRNGVVQWLAREVIQNSPEMKKMLPLLREEIDGVRAIAGESGPDSSMDVMLGAGSSSSTPTTDAGDKGSDIESGIKTGIGIGLAAVNAIPVIGQLISWIGGAIMALENAFEAMGRAIAAAWHDQFSPSAWDAVLWLALFRISPGLIFSGFDKINTPGPGARLVRMFKLISGEAKLKKGWVLHNPRDNGGYSVEFNAWGHNNKLNPYEARVDPTDPLTDPNFLAKIWAQVWPHAPKSKHFTYFDPGDGKKRRGWFPVGADIKNTGRGMQLIDDLDQMWTLDHRDNDPLGVTGLRWHTPYEKDWGPAHFGNAPAVITTQKNAENVLGVLRVALRKAPGIKWTNNPTTFQANYGIITANVLPYVRREIKRIRALAGEHGPDPLLSKAFGDVSLPPGPPAHRRPVARAA